MKIISDFKDYYDFVVRETDNRKTYVRKTHVLNSDEKKEIYNKVFGVKHNYILNLLECATFTFNGVHYFKSTVWFCDGYYRYIKNLETGDFYYAIEQIPKDIYQKSLIEYKHPILRGASRQNRFDWLKKTIEEAKESETTKNEKAFNYMMGWKKKLLFNTIIQAPVIFNKIQSDNIGNVELINGSLKDIQFNKLFKPEEAYQTLYNWIPFIEPVMPNDTNDTQRFEGKGFDKKSSFRHPVNKPKK